MKKTIFFCILLLSPMVFAKARNVDAKTALKTISSGHTLLSLSQVLQTRMNKSDAKFISEALSKSILDINKPVKMNINGNSFKVEGLPGTFVMRMQGKEIVYKSITFRYNSKNTFKQNTEAMAEKLKSKTKVAGTWFVPTAHAQMPTSEDYGLVHTSSLFLASTLKQLAEAVNDPRYQNISEWIAKNPGLGVFLQVNKTVESISCDPDEQTYGKQTMLIRYKDGSKTTFHKRIVDGSTLKAQYFAENATQGMMTFQYREDEEETIASGMMHYCGLNKETRAKIDVALAEAQAQHQFDENSIKPYVKPYVPVGQ